MQHDPQPLHEYVTSTEILLRFCLGVPGVMAEQVEAMAEDKPKVTTSATANGAGKVEVSTCRATKGRRPGICTTAIPSVEQARHAQPSLLTGQD